MLKVGIAGIGFMGWIHWLAYQKVPGVMVAAICETDEKRLSGDWTDIQGNFGPPGEKVDLSGIATYHDLADMVNDDTLDLIDICLPPSFHLMAIEAAANAGKQVFCEKPLALNLHDCDLANQACQRAGVALQVGHVLPFFPEYEFARQEIASGKHGALLGGHFKRVISDPTWLKDFYDPLKVGGPLIDLHIHDAHLIRLLFGMPRQVSSTGRTRNSVVSYCNTIFGFDDPKICVSSMSGVIDQQGRPFTHGFEIHLERATMHFEFAGFSDTGESMPLKILTADGEVIRPTLDNADPLQGFISEISEATQSVKTGHPSEILAGELARDAIEICQAQSESVLSGKTIEL